VQNSVLCLLPHTNVVTDVAKLGFQLPLGAQTNGLLEFVSFGVQKLFNLVQSSLSIIGIFSPELLENYLGIQYQCLCLESYSLCFPIFSGITFRFDPF
jgi:hypothetical protein